MKKCKYCGKRYKENSIEHIEKLPDFIKEKIKFIPDCSCLEEMFKREMEKLEKERVHECMKNRVKKYKDISVVDNKFLESRFENADMSEKYMILAKRYADNFLVKNKKTGMLLYGDVGTGKTFASACIGNYLMEKGKTVMMINLGLYLNKLSREFGEAEKDILEQIEKCDLVIIDDFGTEKNLDDNSTGWRAEKIYNLIDTRYRSGKPLIISTNLIFNDDEEKCEITEKFSIQGKNRIRDRIIDMCFPVRVTGKSRRGITKDKFLEFMA